MLSPLTRPLLALGQGLWSTLIGDEAASAGPSSAMQSPVAAAQPQGGSARASADTSSAALRLFAEADSPAGDKAAPGQAPAGRDSAKALLW